MNSDHDCADQSPLEATAVAVRDFVRACVEFISRLPNEQSTDGIERSRWELGSDGHFRERKFHIRRLEPVENDTWLNSRPEYSAALQAIQSDPLISPHLDRLVGTSFGAQRVEASQILRGAVYSMMDESGHLAYSEEQFRLMWEETLRPFRKSQFSLVVVAPMPRVSIASLPLRLDDSFVLDRLTADEVTKCYVAGVLRPDAPFFPVIWAENAIGMRWTTSVPKRIDNDENREQLPSDLGDGSFACRPIFRSDLLANDVLSALRLLKHGRVTSTGTASWIDCPGWDSGVMFHVLGRWPHFSNYTLSDDEVPALQELWNQIKSLDSAFDFTIHRFNLAFDRGLLTDRIVDLVIAAESLFLRDNSESVRGELSYRCALRAAKFVDHPAFEPRDVFRIMRRAYGVRSTIVHGGQVKAKDTVLTGGTSVGLDKFIDAVEEIVRLAIRKVIAMGANSNDVCKPEYWEELLFSTSTVH